MDTNAPPGPAPPPRSAGGWTAYVTVVMLATVAGAAVLFAFLSLQAGAAVRAARLDAAASVGQKAAAALQATELALRAGAAPAPDAVWGHLDAADAQLELLLVGDPTGDPPLPPLEADLAQRAGRVRALLVNARSVAESRLVNPETAGAGTTLAQRHADQTALLLAEAEALQAGVKALNAESLTAADRVASGLLALAFVLAVGGVATGLRITRRRRRDAARARSAAPRAGDTQAALLATALAQASEIIFVTDAEGRIMYVNDAFVADLGWPREEVLGQYAELLRSEHHPEAFYEEVYAGLREGFAWHGTLHLRRHDGTDLEVEQAITPVRGQGDRVRNFVIVARDVTRERDLKAQVAHVQRLESLGVLARGIAHDLNNILTSVLGNAALCRSPRGGENPHEYLERIETAAGRASELCTQMLAYAAGGKAEKQTVDLSALVREMSRLLEVSMGPGVGLTYDLAPGLPSVDGDPPQLRQVLMNLVLNGSEAVGDGPGTVTVRTGAARVPRSELARAFEGDDLAPGEYVFLEVADTGAGMTRATRERLFEPFFTTKAAGRGLGMSAVRGIVRDHCGALGIKSAPGKGSAFRLLLPPSGRPVPEAPEAPEVGAWTGSGRVLVVDDELSVRQVACRMLESLGFAAQAAPDGPAAMAAFRAHPDAYVCVLLDLTLPGMDGGEIFRSLREVRGDVPVVLISGYGLEEAAARIDQPGVSGFLAKPFTPDQLKGSLRRVLKRPSPQ